MRVRSLPGALPGVFLAEETAETGELLFNQDSGDGLLGGGVLEGGGREVGGGPGGGAEGGAERGRTGEGHPTGLGGEGGVEGGLGRVGEWPAGVLRLGRMIEEHSAGLPRRP